jgi:hydrogenase maturation protein HypF
LTEPARGVVRRSIAVSGVVQGVGFRPFVHELAHRYALGGFVRNRAGDVIIEVEGDAGAVDGFVHELRARPPVLARIERLSCAPEPARGDAGFRIEPSDETRPAEAIFVTPDAATCDACLREIFDPHDRRWRYPFTSCAQCGPRLTIVTDAPYDRARTTMAGFVMCAACRAEYDDPKSRRFHAQPIACPACGPVLRAVASGATRPGPLEHAVATLRAGGIVAVKGLGGYHLACSALDGEAVSKLRRRNHSLSWSRTSRQRRPFAR